MSNPARQALKGLLLLRTGSARLFTPWKPTHHDYPKLENVRVYKAVWCNEEYMGDGWWVPAGWGCRERLIDRWLTPYELRIGWRYSRDEALSVDPLPKNRV